MVELVIKVKVIVHIITVYVSIAPFFTKVLPIINKVSMLDLLAMNLCRVVGIELGFKCFKPFESVIHEGRLVCFPMIPVRVKEVNMREDSVIQVELVEGKSLVSRHPPTNIMWLVRLKICLASFKVAAVEEGVLETGSRKHSVDKTAVNKLSTLKPVLSPLKLHILKRDIFETSILEIHVLKVNILEVGVLHKTVEEVLVLKCFPFKVSVIEFVFAIDLKFITEVLIGSGYHSCKESRGEQDPMRFDHNTCGTIYQVPDTYYISNYLLKI